jgi:hypothetical protein
MYQGEPLVKGKRVTGFTDGEEAAMNLTHVVPFLVEDELKRIGSLRLFLPRVQFVSNHRL